MDSQPAFPYQRRPDLTYAVVQRSGPGWCADTLMAYTLSVRPAQALTRCIRVVFRVRYREV